MSKNQSENSIPLRYGPEQMKVVRDLFSLPSEIVITTHHRPDGDAMGSSLGLYNYLKKKGFSVKVIVPSEYPDFLTWLPGNDEVLIYENASSESERILQKADIIFCLDFNWMSRVDKMEPHLRNSKAKKILIDHHLDPEDAFDVVFSNSDACSTCELIYDFIAALNDTNVIDSKIAECIYCGIMTDTNSFRYSSMRSRTHRIIANLMEAGAENYKIHELVYDNSSESRMKLLGYSLYKRLIVLREFNTAYIALTESELDQFDFKSGDTEGVVNYALGISGIRLAAFFSERDGSIKISFRSKGDFSVKEMSGKYFRGGGHKNASGGYSEDSLNETIKKFVSILPSYITQLID